jgi:hypothetical protein
MANDGVKKIERFFLSTLLRISMAGVSCILLADTLLYPQDTLSIVIDFSILSACVLSYIVREKYPVAAVLVMTSMIMLAMFYQCLAVPINTTTSLSILLIVGFIFSVMLKGKLMWTMQGINFITINIIFILQLLNPRLQFSKESNEVVTVAITYSILYLILSYTTGVLKFHYDKIHHHLHEVNTKLYEKSIEIEAQNEELTLIQDSLHELNKNLEKKVTERTKKLQVKTEKLVQYSFTNAHQLRGPVARLLGLVAIQKLEPNLDPTFYFDKIAEQAAEIDTVVRQINADLSDGITDD